MLKKIILGVLISVAGIILFSVKAHASEESQGEEVCMRAEPTSSTGEDIVYVILSSEIQETIEAISGNKLVIVTQLQKNYNSNWVTINVWSDTVNSRSTEITKKVGNLSGRYRVLVTVKVYNNNVLLRTVKQQSNIYDA